VVGAAIAIVAAVVLVVALGGSSHPAKASSSSTIGGGAPPAASKHAKTHHASTTSTRKTPTTANPSETAVAVLNGTETPQLAHRVSGELQANGYTQAVPLGGHPAGSGQVTVVQYGSGHRGEAEAVAHSLGVSQVQPLESTVAALAGSSNVVVIVGADKATQ
jgi:hypothetical protein